MLEIVVKTCRRNVLDRARCRREKFWVLFLPIRGKTGAEGFRVEKEVREDLRRKIGGDSRVTTADKNVRELGGSMSSHFVWQRCE